MMMQKVAFVSLFCLHLRWKVFLKNPGLMLSSEKKFCTSEYSEPSEYSIEIQKMSIFGFDIWKPEKLNVSLG